MKRFLSLLTVFMLAFVMAVPAYASNGLTSYNGVMAPSLPDDIPYSFVCITSSSKYVYLHITDKPLVIETNGSVKSGDYVTKDVYYSGQKNVAGWTYMSSSEIAPNRLVSNDGYLWSNYDIQNENGETAFEGDESGDIIDFAKFECDGSSCPANDANADDICDDCGRTLSLRATAPEYPTLPTVSGAYKHYVLSKASSGRYDYSVFVSDTPFTVRGNRGSAYIANFSDTATTYRYSSSNGNDWELNVDGSTGSSFTVGATGYLELVQSTFTWYDESGTPFFPKPLYQTMGEVVAEEMPELSQMTGGTMTILTVCGVGCLALLMVLKLFGKRSLLFRG